MRTAPLAALATVLVAAGCGSSAARDEHTAFEQNCAACHAIAQGAQSPVAAAPNLYELQPTAGQVRRAVVHGAPGMPRNLVKGDALDQVVDYVVEQTRR